MPIKMITSCGWFLLFLLFACLTLFFVTFLYIRFQDSLLVGKVRNLCELIMLLFHLKAHTFFKSGKIWSYVDDFEDLVDSSSKDVIQFIFVESNRQITRSELDKRANRIAHWAVSPDINLQQRDTVAFMMLNKPDYVPFWLGMAKVGVRTALLNTNITGKALMHSVCVAIQDSDAKLFVVDEELRDVVHEEVAELQHNGIRVVFWENDKVLEGYGATRPAKSMRNLVKESDPFLYIFTSGTTGLPKASKISHSRYRLGSLPLPTVCYLGPGDRLYNCLPLYHSAGGMLGAGGVLLSGATMVCR
jgi:fatty-acyl-CoA synthase